VRESNQVRRGSAQSTYKAQKRKARELMEEGLVGKAVAMLAPSKVLDVTLEEVASQLKSQVVFNTGAEVLVRGVQVAAVSS
jgi:predicted DNA-binding transcriptional regulator